MNLSHQEEGPGSLLSAAAEETHLGKLTEALERRRRRLGALEKMSRARADLEFARFFKADAPSVFAYRACLGMLKYPDVLDDPSQDIDFLFTRCDHHANALVVSGLLACGSWLGQVATREAVTHARENYGDFAVWAMSHTPATKPRVEAAFPDRDEAYAIGHAGYPLFAARHQPAFDKWVDAICAKPARRALVDPSAALASYLEARRRFHIWEGLDAHQA